MEVREEPSKRGPKGISADQADCLVFKGSHGVETGENAVVATIIVVLRIDFALVFSRVSFRCYGFGIITAVKVALALLSSTFSFFAKTTVG